MKRGFAFAAWALFASQALAGEVNMIHLGGTPAEIGKKWGELNKKAIAHDMDVHYLRKAAAAGISKETLIQRSAKFVQIAEKIAPHWLEEARAIAGAAGVDEAITLPSLAAVPGTGSSTSAPRTRSRASTLAAMPSSFTKQWPA